MSVWDWIREYQREALRRKDLQRARLAEFHPRAYAVRETDPDRALAIYDEGRLLARQLAEPGWALFFDHWRVTMLAWFKQDYRAALDLAVQNTLESRKPNYDPLHLRLTIQRTLLCVYQMIDVFGYADAITQGLAELEEQISLEGEEKYLIQSNRISFAYDMEDYARAEEACLQTLRWADVDGDCHDAVHHSVYAYRMLCLVAWKRNDRQALDEWAEAGSEIVERSRHQMEGIEFVLWQAYLARSHGEEQRAQRLLRQAQSRLGRLRTPPSGIYYEALCAYHELHDDWARVLKLRRRELETLSQLGQLDEEVRCRIKICRLLMKMGRSVKTEIEGARVAAGRLKAPRRYLDELDRLERGETA